MIMIQNLQKPDNKKWKLIADIALYSLPLLTGVVVTIPVSDNIQKWILVVFNVLIVGFKTISKFTSDETNQ